MTWSRLLTMMRKAESNTDVMKCVRYAERMARRDRRTTAVAYYGCYAEIDDAEDCWTEACIYLSTVVIPQGMDAHRWVRLSQLICIGAMERTGEDLDGTPLPGPQSQSICD